MFKEMIDGNVSEDEKKVGEEIDSFIKSKGFNVYVLSARRDNGQGTCLLFGNAILLHECFSRLAGHLKTIYKDFINNDKSKVH